MWKCKKLFLLKRKEILLATESTQNNFRKHSAFLSLHFQRCGYLKWKQFPSSISQLSPNTLKIKKLGLVPSRLGFPPLHLVHIVDQGVCLRFCIATVSPVSVATDANACVPIMQAEELIASIDTFPMNVVDKPVSFRRALIAKSFEASSLCSLVHVITTLVKQLEAAEL